jgi:hypothetical protein
MYTKQEASLIKKKFWTSFGRYLQPVPNAEGENINWLNYKTGIRDIFFRMDVDAASAQIAIEIKHTVNSLDNRYYEQLLAMRTMLENTLGETWQWQPEVQDEFGAVLSRVYTTKPGVNIFKESDWPAIITFLKPRIIALDEFWLQVKDVFS